MKQVCYPSVPTPEHVVCALAARLSHPRRRNRLAPFRRTHGVVLALQRSEVKSYLNLNHFTPGNKSIFDTHFSTQEEEEEKKVLVAFLEMKSFHWNSLARC